MIYEAVSIANSRHEDQYIFGGYNTQDAPYELILDPDPNSDEVVGVQSQPQHMDKTIYRLTADGERVPANVAGNDIFQPGSQGDTDDLFQILVDLRDAMNDGILNDPEQDPPLPPSDPNYDPADPVWTEAEYDSLRVIQEGLERVDGALTRTRSALTRVGGWVKRMQNTEQRHMDLDVRESEHLADTQDADLTEWITKFQLQSIALQQAMNVGNQVLHASLVNFIR
jgi:flagellin-like hook-associated protein FlgL